MEQISLFNTEGQVVQKEIRTEQQVNKKVAYDVGEKIGGARKDEARLRKEFEELRTVRNLQKLEDCSPVLASEMITKHELFKGFSLEKEKEKGTDPVVARTKQLIIQRIDKSPSVDSREGREAFLLAAEYYEKVMDSVFTLDELITTVYSLRSKLHREKTTIEHCEKQIAYATNRLASLSKEDPKYKVVQSDVEGYKKLLESVIEAKKVPLGCLGTKFTNFFTNHKSANATLNNVQSKVKSWDDLLTPKTTKRTKGSVKPIWERKLPERPDRKGGRETDNKSAEKLMNAFGFRAIEFGNYISDEVGTAHIFRASEAYLDLSDILEMDHDYSISLNGSLAMAFGSRGRGSALGHYEPKSKVINLTRDRGCLGITAHEWFHALDNYLYDGSHNHKNGKIGYLSNLEEIGLGISPSIVEAARKLMASIKEGDGTAYFENTNKDGVSWRLASRTVNDYNHLNGDLFEMMKRKKAELDHSLERRLSIVSFINDDIEKARAKERKAHERALKKYAQAIAWLHEEKTGDRVLQIPYPSNKSSFLLSAITLDRGKEGKYWSSSVELAARAFEAYVEDKLEQADRKNDYLVCGTKDSLAFPTGEQRETINQHFDELFALIRKVHLL